MKQLPDGAYNYAETEARILKFWLENGFYKPEYSPINDNMQTIEEMKADPREAFSIILPPPNAYGRPHIGNISGYAYQDAMGRYARQQGKKVLLLPGKDHAGLEGEGVYIREVLEKEGTDKFSLGREEFYKRIWDFNQQNMELALKDEQTIGLSADYDRNLFTLDPRIVDTVLSTFVDMYQKKMIYRGTRIINWDPKARSTIADNQCERKEKEGEMWYIRYEIVQENLDEVSRETLNNKGDQSDGNYILVATARPETIWADTAVAVNPEDTRYKHLIGKKVIIPSTNTQVPIITSPRVLTDFGTGCLKITPAHSLDDFTIMNEWNKENPDKQIGYINVIGKDLRLVGPVPEKYKGRKYTQIGDELAAELTELGLLEKREKIMQNKLVSERTGAVVEPLISSQWFVDVETFKKPVMDMVKNSAVRIHPNNMEDKFFYWMENLRDWAISRSLWWGYRLPVWYAGEVEERIDDNGQVEMWIEIDGDWEALNPANPNHMLVQLEQPATNWHQDPDVLDTWFSSGQWPYATLRVFDLMDTFYPTDVMETGFDILENWVSRMMMFSWFNEGKEPFKDVYLHGMVLGSDGQKMSKSRKNLIPLDDAQAQYGIDALRLVYFYQNKAGASYSLSHEKLKTFRNFNNKIWNAAKFIINNTIDLNTEKLSVVKNFAQFEELANNLGLKFNEIDQSFLDILKEQEKEYHDHFGKFRFGLLTEGLYQTFWHGLCDEYIENSKALLTDGSTKTATQYVLIYALRSYLKMLHPFIPHLTEEIWQYIKNEGEAKSLMYDSWR